MYNKILQLIAGLVNVLGTAYAILSVLRLTPEDIHNVIRIKGIEERDKELIVQRKQARIGICLVALAWLFQVIFSFVNVIENVAFIAAVVGMVLVIGMTMTIISRANKKFEAEYTEYSRVELEKHGISREKQTR